VFQRVGMLVDVFPRNVNAGGEEQFDQAVTADDLKRELLPSGVRRTP
jgi:hypothetical protein